MESFAVQWLNRTGNRSAKALSPHQTSNQKEVLRPLPMQTDVIVGIVVVGSEELPNVDHVGHLPCRVARHARWRTQRDQAEEFAVCSLCISLSSRQMFGFQPSKILSCAHIFPSDEALTSRGFIASPHEDAPSLVHLFDDTWREWKSTHQIVKLTVQHSLPGLPAP